jgi:hypothetical protein
MILTQKIWNYTLKQRLSRILLGILPVICLGALSNREFTAWIVVISAILTVYGKKQPGYSTGET